MRKAMLSIVTWRSLLMMLLALDRKVARLPLVVQEQEVPSVVALVPLVQEGCLEAWA